MAEGRGFSLRLLIFNVLVCSIQAQFIDYSYSNVLQRSASQKLPSFQNLAGMQKQLNNMGMQNFGRFQLSDLSLESLPTDVSGLCLNETLDWLGKASRFDLSALSMLDAAGKVPSGVREGDFVWTGAYDECMNVSMAMQDQPYEGKYCKAIITTVIPPTTILQSYIGFCFPDACSSRDVEGLLNTVPEIASLIFHFNISESPAIKIECSDRHVPLDGKAIVSIVIVSIFLTLMIVGTVYDIYYHYATGFFSKDEEVPIKVHVQEPPNHVPADERTPLVNSGPAVESQEKLNHAVKQTANAEMNTIGKVLVCFSAYTNSRKIMAVAQPKGALTCIHGIRFFSITWVVLGHALAFVQTFIKNKLWVADLMKRPSFGAVLNATVSVDSFFVMSGLLLAYLTLKELDKREGRLGGKGWVMIYVHRYIRLTPVYALLLMVWSSLLWYMGDGPLWPTKDHTFDPNCASNWWTNLLYINNIVDSDKQCFGWAWYLANDMQFFAISIPMIYLLFKKRLIGLIVIASMTVASMIAAIIVSTTDNMHVGMGGKNYMSDYYFAPWCRFQTYGVGLLTGYMLHITKCRLRIHWALNIFLWAVAAALCLLPLYGPHDAMFTPGQNSVAQGAAYNGLARTSWAVGLAWVMVACITGNGGIINQFLSWKAFVPLGRLSYCVYLTNLMVFYYYILGEREPATFHEIHLTVYFLGGLVLNFMAGFVASVFWEAPTMALEKILFKR